ncbi:MAG: hypothetical protein ACTS6A_00525 [Candidatus Hodgkinia cicadicola]
MYSLCEAVTNASRRKSKANVGVGNWLEESLVQNGSGRINWYRPNVVRNVI